MGEVCACRACEKARKERKWACLNCGFLGPPETIPCQCLEISCSGIWGGGRGFCCPHGALICPVCENEEMSNKEFYLAKILTVIEHDGTEEDLDDKLLKTAEFQSRLEDMEWTDKNVLEIKKEYWERELWPEKDQSTGE